MTRGRTLIPTGPRDALDRARPYIMTAMIPIVVMAAGSLVLEYGFRVSEYTRSVLHWIEAVALVGLMLDSPLRLLLARHRWALLKFRWLEFSVAVAYAAVIGFYYAARFPAAESLAIRTTHVAIVVNLIIRLTELNRFLATLRVRPALLMIGSFMTLIAVGTGLLLLPASTEEGRPETTFMDALFTSTSAVCVTGLTVVDVGDHFTPFGQYVALTLIQLGGLGLMTFGSVFALFMWRGLRLRESMVMREVVSHDLVAEIRRVVLFILLSTLCIEAAGAVLLMGAWTETHAGAAISLADRTYYSIFHSVAAFCNAGFGLYGQNFDRDELRGSWQINVIIPILIITGGIGFGVLYNLVRSVLYRLRPGPGHVPLVKKRWTLQTKLAIMMTVCLLVGGTVLAFVFETFHSGTGSWQVTAYMPEEQGSGAFSGCSEKGPDPFSFEAAKGSDPFSQRREKASDPIAEHSPLGETSNERLVGAWFLSTTARTAGFNSTDTRRLSQPTKFLTVVLMFIGASPGSTGGGIKTVTFAVICLGIWSALRGRVHAQVFHRTIAWETVTRALAVMAVSAIWVAVIAMILCAWGLRDGARYTFLDVLFEVTSAFGTVGLSTGTTPLLSTFGRLLIIITMFVGRVGPLSLFLSMQGRSEAAARYTYPTEGVATS